MSVRSFMRELSNVSSARSVLMSQYNTTARPSADGMSESSGGHSSSLSSTDSDNSSTGSDSSSRKIKDCSNRDNDGNHPSAMVVGNTFENYSTNNTSSHSHSPTGAGTVATVSSSHNKHLTCILTPREMASSKSLISRELFIKLKNAGTRIFTAAMILSYRRQREQIKKLIQDNDELRRKCWKYDQQAYVYQKLYDDEKERNYELQNKLRTSQNKAAQTRGKRETLIESIENLKSSNELLEKQLHAQEEQFEGLQLSFAEVQSSLFQSMARERELQRQLSEEQRRVRTLIVNESDLVLQLHDFKQCADDKKKNLWNQLKCKQAILARYKQEKEVLSSTLSGLLVKKTEFDVMGAELQNSLNEISQIKQNLQSLRLQLENSWTNRLKRFWLESRSIRLRFAEIILVVGYCILPSVHVARTSLYAKIPVRAVFG